MHRFVTISAGKLPALLLGLGLVLVACATTPGASTGSGSSSAPESQGGVSGEATVEGSLVGSGLYDAT
jgi:hypothetical protein